MKKDSSPKHLIIGPGAIGISLFSLLNRKFESYLVEKPGRSFETGTPLTIHGDIQDTFSPDQQVLQAQQICELDGQLTFWVTVKAYDLQSCLSNIKSYLQKDSTLIICANGLNLTMDIAHLVNVNQRMVRCLFSFGALQTSPREIVVSGRPSATLAAISTIPEEALRISQILESVGFRVTVEQNIARAEWRKAFVNLIVNPLCCVTDQKNEAVYRDPALRTLASGIFEEIQSVTRAENFDFSDITLEKLLESLKPFGANFNNTLVDLRRGKRSDSEYLLGRFVAFAEQHSLQVPISSTLLQLVRSLESNKTLARSC